MTSVQPAESFEDRLAAKWRVIRPYLDEQQRRVWLGLEAADLGFGGIEVVSSATGADENTIRAGMREAESGTPPTGQMRRAGGGRKPITETQPGIAEALCDLVSPAERGDPMSVLRWTTDSTRDLARKLGELGYEISHVKVGELLHVEGCQRQSLGGRTARRPGQAVPVHR